MREEIIRAWKNPERRTAGAAAHPSGTSLMELTDGDLAFVQGAGDVNAESMTPSTITIPIWIYFGHRYSILFC